MNQLPALLLTLTASLLLTASCSSGSVIDEPEQPGSTPIAFHHALNRGVVGNDKKGMQSFSVWGWNYPTSTTGTAANPTSVFHRTEVQTDGSYTPLQHWQPGRTYHFYALHPHQLTPSNVTEVTCTPEGTLTVKGFNAAAQRGEKAVDLMSAYAPGYDGSTPQTVGLTFQHELTQVEIQIATEQEITMNDAQLNHIIYQGDLSLSPDALTGTPVAQWTNPLRTDAQTGEPLHDPCQDASGQPIRLTPQSQPISLFNGVLLLPPQLLESASTVFTLSWTYVQPQETRVEALHIPANGIHEWQRGVRYVYTAVIPPTPAPVRLLVSIKPWKKTRVDATL